MRIVLPASHPVARQRVVRLLDLADETWIRSTNRSSCNPFTERACRAAGFEPRIRFEFDDYAAMQSLVASGAGVAFAPDLGLSRPNPGVAVRPIAFGPKRRVHAAFRAGERDEHGLPEMLDALRGGGSRARAPLPRPRRRLVSRRLPPAAEKVRNLTGMRRGAACGRCSCSGRRTGGRRRRNRDGLDDGANHRVDHWGQPPRASPPGALPGSTRARPPPAGRSTSKRSWDRPRLTGPSPPRRRGQPRPPLHRRADGAHSGSVLGTGDRLLEEPVPRPLLAPSSIGNEQGLLSAVFHPDFASNGLLYVNYTERGRRHPGRGVSRALAGGRARRGARDSLRPSAVREPQRGAARLWPGRAPVRRHGGRRVRERSREPRAGPLRPAGEDAAAWTSTGRTPSGRCSATACATPGASPSTGSRAISGSATSGRARSRRSTSSRPPTSAGCTTSAGTSSRAPMLVEDKPLTPGRDPRRAAERVHP